MKPSEQRREIPPSFIAVCRSIGAFIEYWGFKGVQGEVWAYVALHNAPVSQVEIAHGLDVSRATVSLAVKALEELGLIRRVGGGRNAKIEPVVDVWPVVSKILKSREFVLVQNAEDALRLLLEDIRSERAWSGGQSVYSEERVLTLISLTDLAKGVLATITRLRVPPSIGGFGSDSTGVSLVFGSGIKESSRS